MRITNPHKFEEMCKTYSKQELKALLEHLAFSRIVSELTLVDIFRKVRKNGDPVPKSETLEDFKSVLEGEHFLINLIGREEAAKVYGRMEGVTSDIKMVDFILKEDSIEYYRKMIL